ncbi:MAG TPA: ABC transporter ATP-binding protein, partial [Candidatus Limnocylindria bacterium]|nr:ABC transporter ATP-binding protein [Candidatus Limnocylindria bacterium]
MANNVDANDPISLLHVTRRFGDVVAVDDVSFSLAPGTILGLIGPSGSGKTTILRMLTGSLAPTNGEVRVLGEPPTRFRARTRERIGYMPQNFVLYPELTASENLSFVGALFGMYVLKRRRRVREVLELVDLWDVRDRRASKLSGGMQRRLALAAAFVHEPEILFIDEPTAGIDPILRARIWEELRRQAAEGRTFIVTTQYVGEAEHCDGVALLAGGELLALNSPAELRHEVYGGDILDVRTHREFDARSLEGVPGVLSAKQRGPRGVIV